MLCSSGKFSILECMILSKAFDKVYKSDDAGRQFFKNMWFQIWTMVTNLQDPIRQHRGEAMFISLIDFQWISTKAKSFQ